MIWFRLYFLDTKSRISARDEFEAEDDERAMTIAGLLRPGGRLVIAFNSPYGSVVRGNVPDYFDAGATSPYRGLWAAGIKTYLQHRTLEDYLDAFIAAGLRLTKLADSRDHCFDPQPESILPHGFRFPRFLLLAFTKP